MTNLDLFVIETNKIEGIIREPTKQETKAHEALLALDTLDVPAIQKFVHAVQPGARLREFEHMNVRVGSHFPPRGGPEIASGLNDILYRANEGNDPFGVHVLYETLHPFSDGNGRSGRAIWLWQMINQRVDYRPLTLGFLHLFYYQTLGSSR